MNRLSRSDYALVVAAQGGASFALYKICRIIEALHKISGNSNFPDVLSFSLQVAILTFIGIVYLILREYFTSCTVLVSLLGLVLVDVVICYVTIWASLVPLTRVTIDMVGVIN